VSDPTFSIPAKLARTAVELHGSAGADWLKRLPGIVAGCVERWSLTLSPPFEDAGYSYVAPARRDGGPAAVLKVAFVWHELTSEAEALRWYGGRGAVELLEADDDAGALLMEQALPGTPLAAIADDEEATRIAAGLMRELWRSAPRDDRLATVEGWAKGLQKLRECYGGGTGPFPAWLVERAERNFAELMASTTEMVLLHGDLHHANIRAAQRRPWLAIDPKGVIGDRGYEVGPLMSNPHDPHEVPDLAGMLARRLDVLTEELGIDRERLHAWAVFHAVLSEWWSVEDQPGHEVDTYYGETLASLEA
jgi:streptomycin 6-kinase